MEPANGKGFRLDSRKPTEPVLPRTEAQRPPLVGKPTLGFTPGGSHRLGLRPTRFGSVGNEKETVAIGSRSCFSHLWTVGVQPFFGGYSFTRFLVEPGMEGMSPN